ncbi:putative histone H2A-3 [Nymphaea thermarum]|nr:putative histone H2A-3 [Nymphaea thermarum]
MSSIISKDKVLELAGNAARDKKKRRIVPRHIHLVVRNGEELSKLLGALTTAKGGVMPNIHNVLLPKKIGTSAFLKISRDYEDEGFSNRNGVHQERGDVLLGLPVRNPESISILVEEVGDASKIHRGIYQGSGHVACRSTFLVQLLPRLVLHAVDVLKGGLLLHALLVHVAVHRRLNVPAF